jgi:hypothetical protein
MTIPLDVHNPGRGTRRTLKGQLISFIPLSSCFIAKLNLHFYTHKTEARNQILLFPPFSRFGLIRDKNSQLAFQAKVGIK